MYGATIGKTAIIKKESTTNQAICAILPDNSFDSFYLQQLLISKRKILISFGMGAGQPNINQEIIRTFHILFPPLSEQQKVSTILSNIDNLISNTQQIIDQTKSLKKGLMQKLLTRGIGHTKFKKVKWFFRKEIEIPQEWNVKKLRQLVESNSDIVAGPFGSNLKVSDYTQNGVSLVRLQNIERHRFVDENIVCIRAEKAEELKYHSFKGGDLLLAKLGDPIGKTCEAPQKIKNGILVGDVVRIRISSSKAFKTLVEYCLNYKQALIQFNREKIGTTRPRINLSHVRNLVFPISSLIIEQQKIASILSNVDSQITTQTQHKEKLERLKKSLMQKLLTGQVRVTV